MTTVEVSPRSPFITVNGVTVPALILEDGVCVESIGPGLQKVDVSFLASEVLWQGDAHDTDEPTPIFNQLQKELNCQEFLDGCQ